MRLKLLCKAPLSANHLKFDYEFKQIQKLAAPPAPSHGTLVCRCTLVGNHCSMLSTLCLLWRNNREVHGFVQAYLGQNS